MKRIAIFVSIVAGAFGVQAQTNQKLERAAFLCDSVASVLAEHRARYGANEALREELTPVILSLEKEAVRLQAEYEKELDAILQRDAKSALNAYDEALKVAAEKAEQNPIVEKQNSIEVVDKSRMKRDLVANDFFAERLSQADYKSLCDAQKNETRVKNIVARYITAYGELLALQRRYMEATTEVEANDATTLFNAKNGAITKLDEEINSVWSSLYYNKIYVYDLLMEQEGKSAMIDFSAAAVARAEREIAENSDQYQSDALVGYFARKKALTEYEMQIASTLSLTSSRDSLKTVMDALKNSDYRLSKLSLQHRSFIDYKDIEVKQPSIYNSSNPVPKIRVYDYGTVYRIRIGIFTKRPSISVLRGVTPLYYTTEYNDGQYAYFVGGFRTKQEAVEGVRYLKRLGFKDPIISVWVDGEYYPTLEDMRLSQSLYNIEISGVATLSDVMKAKIALHKSYCSISRVGSTFVVGAFEGKSAAESLATELRKIDGNMVVTVIKR
jgi:hypothetical protein